MRLPRKLLSRSSVNVTLEQETVFVHPPTKEDEPADDPLITGTAVLALDKSRSVRRILIRLDATANIYGGSDYPYQTLTVFEKQLTLDLDETLDQGQHAFHFAFIYPSSGPVYQRSLYGRIRHRVTATVEFSRKTTPRLTSGPAPVYIVANPALPGELPDPLDRALDHFSDDLGPIALRLSSPHLTVASLVSIHLSFLAPPKDCVLQSISLTIIQGFTVTYTTTNKIAKPVPKKYVLGKVSSSLPTSTVVPLVPSPTTFSHLSVDNRPVQNETFIDEQTPLHMLKEGCEFHYSAMFRIPTDDFIRPTTLDGTNTIIKVAHRMLLEVRYTRSGDTDDRLLSIQRPVEIASCCCLSEYQSVPPYSERPVDETPLLELNAATLRRRCLCNTTFGPRETFDNLAVARALTIDNERSIYSEPSLASPTSWLRTSFSDRFEDEWLLASRNFETEDAEVRWRRDNKTAPAHVQGIEGRV
ncbi:hypothetical protein OIV83_000321 [Microbotryomycetes sp. JL201]|nr:hypothetical protein OIV83_000321 [Microbotryomycetes sp. JL201]